ncbi:MAG: hypothetical protein U9P72_11415 [Campylobacterota bacterium]|nr:hypothetical protein [Campylobacterota bacterium]
MEFFRKNKIIVTRVIGSLMFLIGFSVYIWSLTGQTLDANQRAMANIARMEAGAKAGVFNTKISDVQNGGNFLQQVRDVQKNNTKNLTLVAMVLGAILLWYSFFSMKPSD